MQAPSKAALWMATAMAGALIAVFALVRDAPPPVVHVPSETLTGQYGGHDVVQALQQIVETRADVPGAPVAKEAPETSGATAFQARLDAAGFSPLSELQWRRAWELAETPQARTAVLDRLQAASAR